MKNRRETPETITPEFEDTGLFKNTVGNIVVEVVPMMYRNSRQDLVIRGFTAKEREIEVVFAGRRVKQAMQLETYLIASRKRVVQMAKERDAAVPDMDTLRCKLNVEGAWRPRFFRDKSGWESRIYQLIAARWDLFDEKGNAVSFGAPFANAPSQNVEQ